MRLSFVSTIGRDGDPDPRCSWWDKQGCREKLCENKHLAWLGFLPPLHLHVLAGKSPTGHYGATTRPLIEHLIFAIGQPAHGCCGANGATCGPFRNTGLNQDSMNQWGLPARPLGTHTYLDVVHQCDLIWPRTCCMHANFFEQLDVVTSLACKMFITETKHNLISPTVVKHIA